MLHANNRGLSRV